MIEPVSPMIVPVRVCSAICTIAVLLVCSRPSWAGASFDCAKASTPVEKTICADEDLSHIDGIMGRIFSALRDPAASGIPSFVTEQRRWLRRRDEICRKTDANSNNASDYEASVSCLKDAYRERLRDIIHNYIGKRKTYEMVMSEDDGSCRPLLRVYNLIDDIYSHQANGKADEVQGLWEENYEELFEAAGFLEPSKPYPELKQFQEGPGTSLYYDDIFGNGERRFFYIHTNITAKEVDDTVVENEESTTYLFRRGVSPAFFQDDALKKKYGIVTYLSAHQLESFVNFRSVATQILPEEINAGLGVISSRGYNLKKWQEKHSPAQHIGSALQIPPPFTGQNTIQHAFSFNGKVLFVSHRQQFPSIVKESSIIIVYKFASPASIDDVCYIVNPNGVLRKE